ncbi:hypothetical protein KCV00_g9198, partial [Aureobasidium melanogenum]
MEQVRQQLGPPGQGYSMHYIQRPQCQQAMQAVMPQPSTHQRQDSGYAQGHPSQIYGLPAHHASPAASPIVPSRHPSNGFVTQRPAVGPPNSSMVENSDTDAGFANLAINHIMKRFGSQFAGYESTTQSLCGKVDLVQSQVRQLENTVTSFWREIDAKLESTRSPVIKQSTTEVGSIKKPSSTASAIPACEFGRMVSIQGKADISASNQEYQDPLNSDQRPDVPTEGQDSSAGIFHGSLRQRLDCMAKLVSTQQVGHTITNDCFNKVFEMLQSASDHSANVVTKQDLEALRVGTKRDLEIFRRTLRQDLETERRATMQEVRTLFEEFRQDLGSFRETKQDFETIRKEHDQHVLNTERQLKECLVSQTNTLEAFTSSGNCIQQELSSVRATLKVLEEVVTARLPVEEDQPEVAKARSPAFSFAQIVKIGYDPSNGAADAGEVGVHLQGQSTQALQSITGVAQTCTDADLEIVSSSRERVGNRAKAPEKLAEMHSNELCPKTLASLLRSYMSSTSPSLGRSQEPSVSPKRSRAISEEKPVQQVLGREEVRTEVRSSLDREKRQKKHKSKHRVDLDGVFDPKQLLSRTPALVNSSGGSTHGQKVQKRKWEVAEIPQSRADLLQQQQQAYRKRQKK